MGCSGGDTEGELEKKARGGFSNGLLAGVMGVAAGLVLGGVPIGFYALSEGEERGYEAGKKAGVAEAQEQAPDVKVQLLPSFFYDGVTDAYFSAEQTRGDEKLTYLLDVIPTKVYPGEIGEEPHIDVTRVSEKVIIERADGIEVSYYDGDLDVQVHEDSCRAGPRDGLVDSITVFQPGKGSSLFCRVRDYDANPTVFRRADARFNEIRNQYFDSEQ